MDLSYLFLAVLPFALFLWLALKPHCGFYTLWHFGAAGCVLFCDTDLAHGSPWHTLCVFDVCSTESVPAGALGEEQALWKRALAGLLKGFRPSSVLSLALFHLAAVFCFCMTRLKTGFTPPWEHSAMGASSALVLL